MEISISIFDQNFTIPTSDHNFDFWPNKLIVFLKLSIRQISLNFLEHPINSGLDDITVSVNNSQLIPAGNDKWELDFSLGTATQVDVIWK